MCRKLTKEEFVNKSKKIHNDKYDYSLVKYENNSTKVKIICKIHGEFYQSPNSHISNGSGYYECGYLYRNNHKSNIDEFIMKSKKVHKDKFDYSKVTYKTNKIKVKIICKIHGEFEQRPDCHLNGQGCKKCAGTVNKTKNEFVKESIIMHNNKYDYYAQ